MIGALPATLAKTAPLLVIVDEGHHAAAKSYQPIFTAPYPLRALFLTATPNRTDGLPIGIDSIAYTITYRELADRGVIIIPEFESFPVPDFDWSEDSIADLADDVIDRTAQDFKKTLVLAPRIDRVEEFRARTAFSVGVTKPLHSCRSSGRPDPAGTFAAAQASISVLPKRQRPDARLIGSRAGGPVSYHGCRRAIFQGCLVY